MDDKPQSIDEKQLLAQLIAASHELREVLCLRRKALNGTINAIEAMIAAADRGEISAAEFSKGVLESVDAIKDLALPMMPPVTTTMQ